MAVATPPAESSPPVPPSGPPRRVPWAPLALLALSILTLVGFFVYPTYPNYDSTYSMLWGRELLDGRLPSFEAYRAPTQHPLAIVFGALLSLLGEGADRIMVLCTLASFVVLCAGVYRLGKVAFTPLVGFAAAAILCTRFDFPFLAARAYIDIPYLVFVVWAAAFELEQPRRGGRVWVLLVCAGLLRPEAWLLLGIYFLWCNTGPLTLADRARTAVYTAIAPVVWVFTDYVVTGRPLFSLQHTSGLAEELGRTKGLREVPSAMQHFFYNLDKKPVVYLGIVGALIALWITPRRIVMPVVLWLIGVGTFVMVGIAGLSVIDRYLLVPSLMVMLFAAVAVAGWTMLERGRLRTAWIVLAAAGVVYGAIFSATRVNFGTFDRELTLRGESHASLKRLLDDPRVRKGMACGPVSVPTHKLITDTRWILDAGEDQVVARSDDAQAKRIKRGVAIYATSRSVLLRQALVEDSDDPFDNIPMAGFTFIRSTGHFGAYVRC
ncbi:MAG: hypothetical protein HZB46_10645 [Solirubrobacterales bacterium]|nr:hypothetical protein [Solirubrobacterales bacterium]